jgi:hypothetical protein
MLCAWTLLQLVDILTHTTRFNPSKYVKYDLFHLPQACGANRGPCQDLT